MPLRFEALVRTALRRKGLELKPIGAPVRGYADFMSRVARRGLRPGTVIDVGVATGTPWLHGRFPEAQLVLVEPNPRFEQPLSQMATQWNAVVFRHAVGASSGVLVLHEDQAAPSSTSAFPLDLGLRQKREARDGVRSFADIRVPIKTLDETLGTRFPGPYLLKIDTEGFEREVLLGATKTLESTAMIIVESSVAPRFQGACSFAELVRLMDERGFRLFDILYVKPLGRGGAINYMDTAFIRKDVDLDISS